MLVNDPDFPNLSKVNAHTPPENISVFAEIESIDVSAPAGMSVHQDLGRILCERMPDHDCKLSTDGSPLAGNQLED